MDLAELKEELLAGHPDTGAYSADDVTAAKQLNAPNRQPDRDSLSGGEIAASIVLAEMGALPAGKQEYVKALISCDSMPLTANLKSQLALVFDAGSASRANLLALVKRTGSRAEELGFGTVTPSHVADARRL